MTLRQLKFYYFQVHRQGGGGHSNSVIIPNDDNVMKANILAVGKYCMGCEFLSEVTITKLVSGE